MTSHTQGMNGLARVMFLSNGAIPSRQRHRNGPCTLPILISFIMTQIEETAEKILLWTGVVKWPQKVLSTVSVATQWWRACRICLTTAFPTHHALGLLFVLQGGLTKRQIKPPLVMDILRRYCGGPAIGLVAVRLQEATAIIRFANFMFQVSLSICQYGHIIPANTTIIHNSHLSTYLFGTFSFP